MRLIDLHVDWLLQYVNETNIFEPTLYSGVSGRLGQIAGYLQATEAAVLSCFRRGEDWDGQADPWMALGQLISRLEAEFPGRLLIGPNDFDRWRKDNEGLAWGLLGIEGFDTLIRGPSDVDRLKQLFDRGVRLFQPLYGSTNRLGGSSVLGDDRGLTPLGQHFLETLDTLAPSEAGPRPVFDLAHMNPSTMSDVLGWYESDPLRSQRVLLVYSHGCPIHPGFNSPRAITLDALSRLRALGGYVGVSVSPPFFQSAEQIKEAVSFVASFPFKGRVGREGIAIGTDFMGVDQTLPGLGDAAEVVSWIQANFDRPMANGLLHDNALSLMAVAVGARLPD